MKGWIDIDKCPLCGGTLSYYRTLFSAPYVIVDFLGGDFPMAAHVDFSKCACGLIVQTPRIAEERLAHYYASGLYRSTLGASQEQIDADERTRAEGIAEWLKVRPASVLDIGCGRGFFLRAMHRLSADVMGYEPQEGYTLEDVPVTHVMPMEQYEMVSMIHVLEHASDPFRDLREAAALSTRWLLVEVPGEQCAGGPLRFAHLWQFTLPVLVRMLPQGWRVMDTQSVPNVRVLAEKG